MRLLSVRFACFQRATYSHFFVFPPFLSPEEAGSIAAAFQWRRNVRHLCADVRVGKGGENSRELYLPAMRSSRILSLKLCIHSQSQRSILSRDMNRPMFTNKMVSP
ncbi:hypothetical protein V5799_028172 [Amblyomma americanum]|uniref:Uncharacterized protein n=1 Tax=Amblyomma americanum TaxID=6943 RepID=A0AAQ4DDM4_AMBAM